MNWRTNIFHIYFLNMDFSLIRTLMCMKIFIHSAEICFEGSVSQNVDIGLSFCFMVCRIWNFEKKCKKITKVTRFLP